jgi:transcriptional regulator with XRE-family HTH domain
LGEKVQTLFDRKIAELLSERPDVADELRRMRAHAMLRDALIGVRRSLGFSQHDLARRTGWKQPYVSRFERTAGYNPDSLSIGKIAEYAEACDVRAVIAFIGKNDTKLLASYECSLPLDRRSPVSLGEVKSVGSRSEIDDGASSVVLDEDTERKSARRSYAI